MYEEDNGVKEFSAGVGSVEATAKEDSTECGDKLLLR
jgi:hypothetical protein